MLGLARRSRVAGDLRVDAGNIRDPNRKGKVVIDITGEPGGHQKFQEVNHYVPRDLHEQVVLLLGLLPLVLTYLNRKWQLVTRFNLKVNQMQMQTRGSRKGRRKYGNRDYL
jgi:hypothetical protein